MDPELFNQAVNNIIEKLPEEQAAIIADEIGNLKTGQNTALEEKAAQEQKITELSATRDQLIASNANLLKRIPVNEENKLVPKSSSEQSDEFQKHFANYEAFDQFGRLKR